MSPKTNAFIGYWEIDSMGNKKWALKRITVNLALVEKQQLEELCQLTGRNTTDLIREAIRNLYKKIKTDEKNPG